MPRFVNAQGVEIPMVEVRNSDGSFSWMQLQQPAPPPPAPTYTVGSSVFSSPTAPQAVPQRYQQEIAIGEAPTSLFSTAGERTAAAALLTVLVVSTVYSIWGSK